MRGVPGSFDGKPDCGGPVVVYFYDYTIANRVTVGEKGKVNRATASYNGLNVIPPPQGFLSS